MKRLYHRLRFWLTTDSVCAWCKTVKHRAPLSFIVRRPATHGICRSCCAGVLK